MEGHRMERFGDHQEPHRNSLSDDHQPGFSGEHYNHYHRDHHYYQHHNQNENNRHHRHHHQQIDHHQFEHYDQNGFFGGAGFRSDGGSAYGSGRKRGVFHSARGASPDHNDGGSLAKLYVAPVPKTATEEEIRSLFEEHGNVIEVILPKDKRTGQRQGYCFVKYTTIEEGDRAIAALQNQCTFAGEVSPIKVRYADGERDRLGQVNDKLYVGCLNKLTSKKEIEEIFSAYGTVEDIYIVRDELKQSRGCGFVQFSRREMALAAIKALNGIFTIRGCDQPLIVKFADPKKPRIADPRGNHAFGIINYGPHPHEAAFRPAPNASLSTQQISLNPQAQAVSQWTNQEAAASSVTQQPHPPASKLTQLPQQSSQPGPHAASEVQQQLHLMRPPSQSLEQQPHSQIARLQGISDSQTVSGTPVVSAASQSSHNVTPLECDWSEHTCPDGYNYYYNCVTCESKVGFLPSVAFSLWIYLSHNVINVSRTDLQWEKPKEFSLFEEQLEKQQKLQSARQQLHPSLPDSSKQDAPNEQVQLHTHLLKQKVQLQQPSMSAVEVDNLQIKSQISPAIGTTCH